MVFHWTEIALATTEAQAGGHKPFRSMDTTSKGGMAARSNVSEASDLVPGAVIEPVDLQHML